jgi:hypothetical protein
MAKAKKIESFDIATMEMIRPKIVAGLDAVSKEFGVKVELVSKSYDKMWAQFSLVVNIDDGMTREERDFNKYASKYQITEKLGDTVMSDGVEFRIVGWISGARSFPIAAVRVSDGRKFGLPAQVLPSRIAEAAKYDAIRALIAKAEESAKAGK